MFVYPTIPIQRQNQRLTTLTQQLQPTTRIQQQRSHINQTHTILPLILSSTTWSPQRRRSQTSTIHTLIWESHINHIQQQSLLLTTLIQQLNRRHITPTLQQPPTTLTQQQRVQLITLTQQQRPTTLILLQPRNHTSTIHTLIWKSHTIHIQQLNPRLTTLMWLLNFVLPAVLGGFFILKFKFVESWS